MIGGAARDRLAPRCQDFAVPGNCPLDLIILHDLELAQFLGCIDIQGQQVRLLVLAEVAAAHGQDFAVRGKGQRTKLASLVPDRQLSQGIARGHIGDLDSLKAPGHQAFAIGGEGQGLGAAGVARYFADFFARGGVDQVNLALIVIQGQKLAVARHGQALKKIPGPKTHRSKPEQGRVRQGIPVMIETNGNRLFWLCFLGRSGKGQECCRPYQATTNPPRLLAHDQLPQGPMVHSGTVALAYPAKTRGSRKRFLW